MVSEMASQQEEIHGGPSCFGDAHPPYPKESSAQWITSTVPVKKSRPRVSGRAGARSQMNRKVVLEGQGTPKISKIILGPMDNQQPKGQPTIRAPLSGTTNPKSHQNAYGPISKLKKSHIKSQNESAFAESHRTMDLMFTTC